ncbi:MAG: asparagine synthase (glutamine-hydrolyzing) [Planctomycetales bacterium]|nr:asparagine synthase (glutamine-hydrolyzing) [Planctomycetales bacterium]
MCGFAGIIESVPSRSSHPTDLRELVETMANSLKHRGPDDAGVWVDSRKGVALGFRRLAIVDLSRAGHQPMMSPNGRYVLVFNGEIYNHRAMRRELRTEGIAFVGSSDTETFLRGIEHWGLVDTLAKSVGMFAFAVWDCRESQLHLGRDRMGEKPLYYGLQGTTLLFGSELKALSQHRCFQGVIDRDALARYLRYGYVPSPRSIFKGIDKVPPGAIVTITRESEKLTVSEPHYYWRFSDIVSAGLANLSTRHPSELVEELDNLLRESIRDQMVADVRTGAFLSGGVDSSAVVGVMQSLADRPVSTFSIGFDDERFDESRHARNVAQFLGTEHVDICVTAQMALDTIPLIPQIFDEPFADSSQIPTYLVAQLAKKHVTVSLSGDGGDELFGGYERYKACEQLLPFLSLPKSVRRGASGALALVRSAMKSEKGTIGRKLDLAAELLPISPDDIYRRMMSRWRASEEVVLAASKSIDDPFDAAASIKDFRRRMMTIDGETYLPDDILVKVDRATMAVSLESRAPLLDHRIVEFSTRLPRNLLRRNGQAKWLLRQVLFRYVPQQLVDRPKKGFGVPIADWLRGPLRDWAESLISEDRIRSDGFLNAAVIRNTWQRHCSGEIDASARLWAVLMFQSWLDATVAGRVSGASRAA